MTPEIGRWPAQSVEMWPISRLTPYARNARTHSDAQVAQIAASIKEWGWTVPVLCDETGTIIAGHGRVQAAQRLAIAEVPVMVARGWTNAQVRAYTLADNRLALNAGWDEQILSVELDELRDMDVDLKLLGFEPQELNDLIGTPNTGFDQDEVPPAPVVPVSCPGDLWLLGAHRLLCGDATKAEDVARLMGRATPILMVTDPPYGVDYDPADKDAMTGIRTANSDRGDVPNDDRFDWTEAYILFSGDVAYVWHGDRDGLAIDVGLNLRAAGFVIRTRVVWCKSQHSFGRGHYHYQHESAWYAVRKSRPAKWCGDHIQSTVWNISNKQADHGDHGTQKPVECMAHAIRNHDAPQVYDPFLGSGTTIIAAELTGRACYALEIAPQYVDVSVMRWQAFTGKQATLEGDGRTFEDIKRERSSAIRPH